MSLEVNKLYNVQYNSGSRNGQWRRIFIENYISSGKLYQVYDLDNDCIQKYRDFYITDYYEVDCEIISVDAMFGQSYKIGVAINIEKFVYDFKHETKELFWTGQVFLLTPKKQNSIIFFNDNLQIRKNGKVLTIKHSAKNDEIMELIDGNNTKIAKKGEINRCFELLEELLT